MGIRLRPARLKLGGMWNTMKLVIVGGVAGGASAAARARRLDENAEIVLFERGEYVSFANCGMPYHIGGEIKERDDLLVATPQRLKDRYNIDVRLRSEVTAVDVRSKAIEVTDLQNGRNYRESYDKLILSPGAKPVVPPIPGVDLPGVFTLRDMLDMDRIIRHLDENGVKEAVVVGGGYIGVEMAENLSRKGIGVSIFELAEQILLPFDYEMAAIVENHLRENGIDIMLGDAVAAVEQADKRLRVKTKNGMEKTTDLIILCIGVRPETDLARKAGLAIGSKGGIRVDEHLRTSEPDVFAVGDAVEVKEIVTGKPMVIPLAGPANKQGRIAADNVFGRPSVFKGSQGTSILKAFELTAGCTGANEKMLKAAGIPHLVSHTHANSHAKYYPGATRTSVKLMFDPEGGNVLGAQVVGRELVDKTVDVLAVAVRAGLTVFDLEELEHAYAPPFSNARDAVNIAGFVASNILRGDFEEASWRDIGAFDPETHVFIDVRGKDEIEETFLLDGAIHIPIDDLRKRLGELDKSKVYVPYCAWGLRGYVACRMLLQHGFQCLNLGGGYETFQPPMKAAGKV